MTSNRWIPAVLVLMVLVGSGSVRVAAQVAMNDPGGGVASGGAVEVDRLDPRRVIELVLDSDPSIRLSERSVGIARAGYEETRGATLPNLDLTVQPYGYDHRRVPGGAGEVTQTTHSAGLGLALRQPLPTSGALVGSLDHQLRFVDGEERSVEQVPELALSLTQPLFVNGNVIDTSVFRAGLRSAEISYERAAISDLITRNGSIDQALSLYIQVANLRRTVDLLVQTIALLDRQIETARLDREQGLISDNALLALQVSRNGRRSTLFDTELALLSAEQALARAIGIDTLAGIALDDRIPPIPLPLEEVAQEMTAENPERALQDRALELSREQSLLNELTDRPELSLSFRTTPLYPETRQDPDDTASSIGDYFEDGSGWESSFAVELTVPLVTRREREARERIDTLSLEQEVVSMEDTTRRVSNILQTLLTERRFLTERLSLLQTEIEYEAQRLENEQTLLEAGVSTQLAVDEVTLDLTARRNEAWQAEASLYLNGLEILATVGRDLAAELM